MHVVTIHEAVTEGILIEFLCDPRLWDPRVIERIEAYARGETFTLGSPSPLHAPPRPFLL